MRKLVFSTRFKRDYKSMIKRGYDAGKLETVLELLQAGDSVPEKYRNHPLSGNWKGYQELHIQPDWLLIYKEESDLITLTLTRTGTHSDLFKR